MTTGTRGPTPRVATKVKKTMETKLRTSDRTVQDMERIRLSQFGIRSTSRFSDFVESELISISGATSVWRISEASFKMIS